MGFQYQIRAVGLLTHRGKAAPNFLGSAIAYRDDTHFLTAAHCVGQLESSQLAVSLAPHEEARSVRVQNVIRHSKADVAILVTESNGLSHPFRNYRKRPEVGEEFVAFGYPENVFGVNAREPTARLFRGHYQRFYRHDSFLGYAYQAAELSIPAPAGLSGGPVFLETSMDEVVGVVTENLESSTVLEAVEEIQSPGKTHRDVFRKVITYGVAAVLHDIGDWLDQHVPWR
jgi:hypothetical protein